MFEVYISSRDKLIAGEVKTKAKEISLNLKHKKLSETRWVVT